MLEHITTMVLLQMPLKTSPERKEFSCSVLPLDGLMSMTRHCGHLPWAMLCICTHTFRRLDKFALIEIWSHSRSTHSQLVNACPWGVPVCVLHPRLQDDFKIPKFDPRARKGIHLGPSPLHASSVDMILNSKTKRISPQFHCICDDCCLQCRNTTEENGLIVGWSGFWRLWKN